VRCFCGTVLDAFQESPPMAGQQPEPVAPPGIPPDPVRPRRAA
jgi:hypothetical protein